MANIQQAAKWVREGKRVYRTSQPQSFNVGSPRGSSLGPWTMDDGSEALMYPQDLLADDWVVLEWVN
jgi:hypothetical protein